MTTAFQYLFNQLNSNFIERHNRGKFGRDVEIVGSPGEVAQIEDKLHVLQDKSQDAAKYLGVLRNNGEKIKIIATSGGNYYNLADRIIGFNPSSIEIGDGSLEWHVRPPEIGLGHEIIHSAHDVTNSLGSTRTIEESRTVRAENLIRSSFGEPFRDRY